MCESLRHDRYSEIVSRKRDKVTNERHAKVDNLQTSAEEKEGMKECVAAASARVMETGDWSAMMEAVQDVE